MFQTLAWVPGPWEWIIIVVVALLIFGRRLPEVGKSLGKGIVEFKKGLKGVKDELEDVDRDIDQAARRDPKQLDGSHQAGSETTVKDKTEANA
jgi:sec-independent protein translocase protein TatA